MSFSLKINWRLTEDLLKINLRKWGFISYFRFSNVLPSLKIKTMHLWKRRILILLHLLNKVWLNLLDQQNRPFQLGTSKNITYCQPRFLDRFWLWHWYWKMVWVKPNVCHTMSLNLRPYKYFLTNYFLLTKHHFIFNKLFFKYNCDILVSAKINHKNHFFRYKNLVQSHFIFIIWYDINNTIFEALKHIFMPPVFWCIEMTVRLLVYVEPKTRPWFIMMCAERKRIRRLSEPKRNLTSELILTCPDSPGPILRPSPTEIDRQPDVNETVSHHPNPFSS